MSLANTELPTDPEDLRIFAAALQAEIHAKTLHIEKLRAELAVLRRARFGRSSEKLDQAIDQLELAIGDLEEGEAEAKGRAAAERVGSPASRRPDRQPSGRKPLPEYLPRETVVHEPPCACPSCGGTTLSKIGEDEREVLDHAR
jgi:transposase